MSLMACTRSYQNEAEDPYCGKAIVDGTLLAPTDPFAKRVALLLADNSSCTATPISSNILLTAAHCVHGKKEIHVVFSDSLQCQGNANTPTQTRRVLSSHLYPDFNESVFKGNDVRKVKNDVALVKIEGTIPNGYYISTVYNGRDRLQSDELILLGFGDSREHSDEPPRLRKAQKSFSRSLFRTEEPQQLILDQKSNGGICLGDSGGPQFILTNGVYKILGVNSAVNGPNNSPCHDQAIIMYAPYFFDWIMKKTYELR